MYPDRGGDFLNHDPFNMNSINVHLKKKLELKKKLDFNNWVEYRMPLPSKYKKWSPVIMTV